MAKQLAYDADARAALKRGVDKVADAVRITIGPKGRNVVLDKKFGSPTITNDGVTIAKEIELEDPFENMGAQLVKEVASKTNDIAGDGTTTSVVLAAAITGDGLRNVTAGANPMQLKIGVQKAVDEVVKAIKEQSVQISEREKIAQVATISAADPSIGEMVANAMLQDIAILTGGQVISDELGLKLDSVQLNQLGKARRVTITKDDTTVVEGAGKQDEIKGRINQIKAEIEKTTSDWDKEKLQERLAKLAGGVAVIKVGAATETELKEKKHRMEDAVSATRAAVEEGIVPGGGAVLVHSIKSLENLRNLTGDEATGVQLVRRALEEPLRQIVNNAGWEGSVVVEKVKGLPKGQGFDANKGEYTDMLKAGIVDPTKVTRSALQNAASIAAMLLTTEALVSDIPEKKKEAPAPSMPDY